MNKKSKFFSILIVFILFLGNFLNLEKAFALTISSDSNIVGSKVKEKTDQKNDFVKISDENLKKAINIELNKEKIDNFANRKVNDEIGLKELKELKELNASHLGIKTLKGIENAINLVKIDVSNNDLSQEDLNYLKDLNQLKNLDLANENSEKNKEISDIKQLKKLSYLEELNLAGNHIKNLLPLTNLKNLKKVDVQKNSIIDFSFLNTINLSELKAQEQQIELPEKNFIGTNKFFSVDVFHFLLPNNENTCVVQSPGGWSLVDQSTKLKQTAKINGSTFLHYLVSNQKGNITGVITQKVSEVAMPSKTTAPSEATGLFSSFGLNKTVPTPSTIISSKNNILDPIYKLVADIVFDKAFKRSSPNLEDASNTTSEKAQWGEFLNGAAKSERWITGTPEEGHEVKLHAYYVDHHSNTTVIVQHGYNANSMSVKNQAEMFWNQGYNILLPDARGTGFSEGNYETLGGLESKDINLWINDETNNGKKIILWGQSMGAATVMLATQLKQVKTVIEDCGFTTLENELVDIVDSYIKTIPGATAIAYGGIERIIALINSIYYEPTFGVSLYSVAPKVAVANNGVPKLFIHGTADKFVPFKDMEILFGDASGFKKEFAVNGAGHCQAYSKDPSKYAQEVRDFLSDSLNKPQFTQADWMAALGDDYQISQISIPGTHDSAATHGVLGFGIDQTLSLPEQLNEGIRFLDIRCKYVKGGSFAIHHGSVYQQLMFGDVLNQVIGFLNAHPRETVLMRIKQESSHVDDSTFNNAFLNHYANDSYWKNYFWDNGGDNEQNPKLGDIRGKIVVLYNVAGLNFGLDYAHGIFDIQDDYNANYSKKLNDVINYMNRANTGNIDTGYINYLSSTNVNSGEMNDAIVEELETKNYHRVGILAANFPTERLITDIIDTNIDIMNRKTILSIENAPRYVVYDPQKETLTNENGKKNFSLNGVWSSIITGTNEFNVQIGRVNDPINDWYWYGGDEAKLTLQNTNQENALNYNLSTILNSNIENFKNIPTTNKLGVMFGFNNQGGWGKHIIIPFYVKAPKVIVDDSFSNLQKMVKNHMVNGQGEIGNTVIIKDGNQSWSGQVDKNGDFSVSTPGLKTGDTIQITQVNGTGDKSASDPVKISISFSWGISVPVNINLSSKGKAFNIEFNYGIGKLEIVNSDGTPFTNSSSKHVFDISGTAEYVHNNYVLMPEDSSTDKLDSNVYLYSDITKQGAGEPTGLSDQLYYNAASPDTFAHIKFDTSENTPLIRYITFGIGSGGASAFLKGPASNTISWTASETTPS